MYANEKIKAQKEFSLTKQQIKPRTDYEWIAKTISKKIRLKKQKINVKMPHANKGLIWTMNWLGKPFGKKSNPKNWKNSKNENKIAAACEQKTTSEKANFCSNTVFSLYFEIRAKKFLAAKPLAFSLHFLFGVTKITTPIWLQKWKCVNRS